MVDRDQILNLQTKTYHAISKHDANFLDGSRELVLSDAALVLDVEEFECLCEEGGFFLRRRTLLGKLSLQILLKAAIKNKYESNWEHTYHVCFRESMKDRLTL